MAVYTKLDHESIEKILSNYSIGKLEKFEGIEEGIENSNFLIWVDKKKYILRVDGIYIDAFNFVGDSKKLNQVIFDKISNNLKKIGFLLPNV